MNSLCKHCPQLKCLYMSQQGVIERVSVKDLKSLAYKDKFHHLESIRLHYHGTRYLQSTQHQLKYIKDYLTAKCPKINGILFDLSTEPELDENSEHDFNLHYTYTLYKMSITIRSASYVNFYLKDSCLVEEKVT